MSKIDDAIERIKILECPTGNVEARVAQILEEYGVASSNEISIERDKYIDNVNGEAYRAKILGDANQSIIVVAESGLDDYVAKVTDVYMK
ncbi:hypothetical protein [Clostridium sp. HMP27]|uniref:hypothetical protein n=1 Tax=Clostridium sp. HMP27 TaxID=1487921 RepID=UPI00052BBD9B|nr:hypothetical protein [Clostridium sp. HMP27]KGK85989.1 hypothetical protein DP68_14225 [Clostridium sp. HMP27]